MTVPTQHNYRYRLHSLLERGPLGEVYLAEDTYLSRQVALKVIRLESIPQVDPALREVRCVEERRLLE